MQHELLALERPLEVGAQCQARDDALVHGGLEHAVAALAIALCDVHRGVGVADQLVGVAGAPGLDDGDAEARADHQLVALERERTADRLEDPLGGLDRGGQLLYVLQ